MEAKSKSSKIDSKANNFDEGASGEGSVDSFDELFNNDDGQQNPETQKMTFNFRGSFNPEQSDRVSFYEPSSKMEIENVNKDDNRVEEPPKETQEIQNKFGPKKRNYEEQADILGYKLNRGDLEGFEDDKTGDQFNENVIKAKVEKFRPEAQPIKRKKKAPPKKLLGVLTDPMVFNGISKGYTLMTICYHFRTYRLLSSDSFAARVSSLLSLDTLRAISELKKYSHQLREPEKLLICGLISFHGLSDLYKNYLKIMEIFVDFGLKRPKKLNDYLFSILHCVIFSKMGVKSRIIFSLNFDHFEMNSMFYLKAKNSRGSRKTNSNQAQMEEESTSDQELDIFSVEEEDGVEYLKSQQTKEQAPSSLHEVIKSLLETGLKGTPRARATKIRKELTPCYKMASLHLGSYCDEALHKKNPYLIEVLSNYNKKWLLVKPNTGFIEKNYRTFYQNQFVKTTLITLFAVQRLSCGQVFFQDVSLLRLPKLTRGIFLNRFRLCRSKMKINTLLKMLEALKFNSFVYMTLEERQAHCMELSRIRDLETENLFDNEGNMRYSTFFTRKALFWNAWHAFVPKCLISEIDVGKKSFEICQVIEKVFCHTLVGWKERRRVIKQNQLETPLKTDEGNYVPGKTSLFYAWWQTDEMKIELNEEGKIPKNKYQNMEIMYGVPPGTRHIPIRGLRRSCTLLKIDFAEAVVDFQYRQSMVRPVILGVVVHEKDVMNVIKKYRELREITRINKVKNHDLEMNRMWKMVFKSVYIKLYLKGT